MSGDGNRIVALMPTGGEDPREAVSWLQEQIDGGELKAIVAFVISKDGYHYEGGCFGEGLKSELVYVGHLLIDAVMEASRAEGTPDDEGA